jgi:hypothetical protein
MVCHVAYSYRVSVRERVTLRAGTKTYIYVGSYVVDNSFTGPIAGEG